MNFASGLSVTRTFDDLNRMISQATSGAGTESFDYTARGLVQYTDGLGKATEYEYDPAGRLITITNANTEITRFSYTLAGDLETLTDGRGKTTTWEYDDEGQVSRKLDHNGLELVNFDYDANGRLISRTTPEKGQTIFGYDDVGNLTLVDYPLSQDITYEYDALNRLTNMVDAVGSTSYSYKNFGALASENGPWSSDKETQPRSFQRGTSYC